MVWPTRSIDQTGELRPHRDWYEIIDSFLPVTTLMRTVLIPRQEAGSDFHVNVAAAMAAATAGVSMNWALQQYVDEETIRSRDYYDESDLLREAYELSTTYVRSATDRLQPPEGNQASLGEFASLFALQRLATSFKSAHLLYQLGHRIDGDTIARSILEQVAWALCAASVETEEELEALKPTKAIKALKALYPEAGVMYGSLTRSAHVGDREHRALSRVVNGRTAIVMREPSHEHGSFVLIRLADMWVAVWEVSQAAYLADLEAVVREDGAYRLREDRAFLASAKDHAESIKKFSPPQNEDEATSPGV